MGGCCAPGTLGPARSAAMAGGVNAREIKSGGSSCGDLTKLTAEEAEAAVAQVLRVQESMTPEKREAMVDMDQLLRVLEVAVEREYVDSCREGSNAGHYAHRDSAPSLHSSFGESATSVYSEAGNVFSKSCSSKNISPPGAVQPCSSEKEQMSSNINHRSSEGKQRATSDLAEKVETDLEDSHHVQKGDPCPNSEPSDTRHVRGDKTFCNFERILQHILKLDSGSQDKFLQRRAPSPSRCQPDVLTEFDDYPRGSSDTNSEEAERDRKAVCIAPVANPSCPTHQVGSTSFISLGSVQSKLREKQEITSCISEGSIRVDESDSRIEVSRSAGEPFSNNLKTEHGQVGADDTYANWLDRHSKELGWKKFRRTENLNEHETYTEDDRTFTDGESTDRSSGLKPLQRCLNGVEPDCIRSWTSRGDLADFELHGKDDERTGNAQLKGPVMLSRGQSKSNANIESVVDRETNCSISPQSRGIQEHVSKFSSFQPGEYVKGSFMFTQELQSIDNSYAPLRLMKNPNPSYFIPVSNLEQQQGWACAGLADWAQSESGRSYKPTMAKTALPQSTSPQYISDYGGTDTRENSHLTVETSSSGSRGASRCSRLNSRVETPKSVLSESRSQTTNATHREKVKVCVRMRPFNDHEKVCPLRQLLCIMGTRVMVKEYDRPSLRRSFDSSDTDALEFRVDCVLDDSYLQSYQTEKKEDSQRRMYESIGLPCLEYALDGYNTTVLAYGQVGTGKTYTMMGDGTEQGSGLMPRLAKELMNQLNTKFEGEFEVQVSYLEIYQEKIRDLLAVPKLEVEASRSGSVRGWQANGYDCSDESTYENSVDCDMRSNASFFMGTPRSWRSERIPSICFDTPVLKKEHLKVREHPVTGPYVEGLLWKTVNTWQDLEAVISHGAANRTLAATPLNKLSSRGHTLFTIKLIRGGRRFVYGYPSSSFTLINLVDLAGTEKPQSTTKTSLDRLEESRYINRSLAQLNDVIVNLSRNKKFISYRGSVLTWLLRDSLGGALSKLFLIANISPAEQDFQESVTTLRYASKANRIHNIINSDPDHKKELLVRMKKEIQVLHNLVHDLTKNKASKCVKEQLRHTHIPLLRQFQDMESKPSGIYT